MILPLSYALLILYASLLMTLISANSEQEIGELIARAMEKVDKERIITIVSMSLSH